MTDETDCINKTVFVAIDITKNKHDVKVKWPNGRTKIFKIKNTLAGYQTILNRIKEGTSFPNVEMHDCDMLSGWRQQQPSGSVKMDFEENTNSVLKRIRTMRILNARHEQQLL